MNKATSNTGGAPPGSDERARKYLEAVLKLNPVFESPRILELRQRFTDRRCRPANAGGTGDPSVLHAGESAQLETIRRAFWTTELNQLKEQLTALNSTRFADLRIAVRRLRTVAEHRHVFPELAAASSQAAEFFQAFREVLVSPPDAAAELRQRTAFRTRDLKPVRKLVRAIERKMPQVYELERDWLSMMRRLRTTRVSSGAASSGAWYDKSFDIDWILKILIFLAIVVLRLLTR